jgi:uridine kinase
LREKQKLKNGVVMNSTADLIQAVSPRETVEIYLPDGRVYSGPRGTTLLKFIKTLPDWEHPLVVGAIVNGELRELTYAIDMDARVRPVTIADMDGARIYRRSLTFLLEVAFKELFPEAELTVDYSVASGGFFCQVIGHEPFNNDELHALENQMRELVRQDILFERHTVPLQDAVAYFEKAGEKDKVKLLKYRQKPTLVLYRLGDYRDYHHGYLVPSTAFLRWFALNKMGEGFILRFPRRHSPRELPSVPESPRLLDMFRQYGDWLARLGIDNVGSLNDAITAGRTNEIVLVSEALHALQIAHISNLITERRDQIKVVLIAGPSSSGKTTFSKRLAVQLLAHGISPFPLELDNYFVNREKTPRDENGNYDFEALDALDRDLLADHLRRLIAGEKVQLRRYNFKTGQGEPGEVVRLGPEQLLILEGIHGLNPNLIPSIPQPWTYRIYASCLTQLNLDRHNRISTTDSRLLRRIVRDARERGYTAQDTIGRWESVRRGEQKHIFPFQNNADGMFNSALVYELSALKPLVEPLLRQVPYGTSEYVEAKRLLAFLEWFLPIGKDSIPNNSIVCEFIGGSVLKDFKLWETAE